MTREKTQQILPIIRAFAEGEAIQYISPTGSNWRDIDEIYLGVLIIRPESYRIKPEPIERWVIVLMCDDGTEYIAADYPDKQEAEDTLRKWQAGRLVRLVETLEE